MTIMNERPVVDAVYPEGTCVGLPDGPYIFIPEFGMRVPSFIDPREDLIPPKARNFKRLSYHVPKHFRGFYKPSRFPEQYRHHIADSLELDDQGFVICSGTKKDGTKCPKRAVNLAGVCPNHGGALHPCDKTLMVDSATGQLAVQNQGDRFEKLSRAEKIAGGLIPMSDLSEEEIVGGFIYDENGRKVVSSRFPKKLHQMMVKELHHRMNNYMQMKLPNMLKRINDIAMSDLAEPETSLKASIWLAERTIGKTPDVIIHGKTDAPYDSILESMEADRVQSGKREDYRKGASPDFVASQRLAEEVQSPLDVSVVDDPNVETDEATAEIEPDEEEESDQSSNVDGQSAYQRAENIVSQKQQAIDLQQARKKAKQKRFVKRLIGGGINATDLAWPLLWTRFDGGDGSVAYTARPVCPSELTEAMLAKIATSEAAASKFEEID